MEYGVQGKIKVSIGDVINFSYKNYKEDPKPSVVYLTSGRNDDGEFIVTGFNLNFLKRINDQIELVKIVRRHTNPKTAYSAVASTPRYAKCYRVYSEMYMVGTMKYDLMRRILIPISKPDTSNNKDPRNKK